MSGRVQGVGFRWFVVQAATPLEVVGDVRNLSDGGVEIRARGDERQLEALRAAVLRGPRASRVDGIEELAPEAVPGASGFEIRR